MEDKTVNKEYELLKIEISSMIKILKGIRKAGEYIRLRELQNLNQRMSKIDMRLKDIKEKAEQQTSDV